MADINFPKNEEGLLNAWKAADLLGKIQAKDAPKGSFVFYEGPPTANGRPGVHHVLARSFKDAIIRFKAMSGYHVMRKAGWDTHGLPVELQVEKRLGISGKPQIETLKANKHDSIVEFNAQCKTSVWEFRDLWEKLTERMAYGIDMSEPYVTFDNSYIASVWSILKKISEKKTEDGQPFLYKDYRVSPYCYSCGTGLSSHEVAQGYKDVWDNSVVVGFKLAADHGALKEGDRILVWTTTPWTLPGNIALAVGADVSYVRVATADGAYVLAKDLLAQWQKEMPALADGTVAAELRGADMVGATYEPLFASFAKEGGAYAVYAGDFVTTTDGTGIVHMAPMYGEDDFRLCSANGLPKIHTVDAEGKFVAVGEDKEYLDRLAGLKAKDNATEKIVLELLETRRALAHTAKYQHSYPHCWRCGTPLLYYAKPSWFIRMSALRGELKDLNEQINWVPEHIKEGRFGEWIDNVKDWAISRERYWGTPLPIWTAEGKEPMVCTLDELKSYGVDAAKLNDLHRPFIDDISFETEDGPDTSRPSGSGTGRRVTWTRVPEVLDVWFDSGAMPWAQHGIDATKQELNADQYPAQYISEAIDQTRGWFYTLNAVAALMGMEKPPFMNVICLGHINDAKGHKMSKSKGNIVDPFEIMDKYGADALRWHLFTVNAPGESKNFDEKNVRQVITGTFLTLYNTLTFLETYAGDKDVVALSLSNGDDGKITNPLDLWQIANVNEVARDVTSRLENYDLYNAGVALEGLIDATSTWYLQRSRDRMKDGDADTIGVLSHSLETIARLMAPLAPFIAETVYQRIRKDENDSVHMAAWPVVRELSAAERGAYETMQEVRNASSAGLAKRAELKIKVRQPLSSVTLSGAEKLRAADASYLDIVKEVLNVDEVKFADGAELVVEYDTAITPELQRRGLERELVRMINAERKNQGLKVTDIIPARFATDSAAIADILSSGIINDKVLVTSWTKVDSLDGGAGIEANGESAVIWLKE